jgi:hypothetical protein
MPQRHREESCADLDCRCGISARARENAVTHKYQGITKNEL